jgi:hypothetical protein
MWSRRDPGPRLSQEPCDQPYWFTRGPRPSISGSVGAILLIMRGGGAGHEIAIAPTLLAAQRADALHVAENEGLGTCQIVLVDAECRQHLR